MGLNLGLSRLGKNISRGRYNNGWDEEEILAYEERGNSRGKELVW